MARGGKRDGAGRKPKTEEQQLIEKLKPLEPLAFEALAKLLKKGDQRAVQLFMNYMYGKPKEKMDVTTNGESVKFTVRDLVKFG